MKAFALALAFPALALSAPSSTLSRVVENARLLSVSDAGQQAYLQSCRSADALCAEWSEVNALFHASQTEREVPAGHWAEALADRQKSCNVPVFYPFGGPDVIYPRRLFPSCHVFVLAGLEPVGGAELSGDLYQPANAAFVRAARRSLASLLVRGYFVTKYLERDLRAGRAGGVLPLMLMQLVRGGAVVQDILVPGPGKHSQFRTGAFSKESTNISAVCILFHEAGQAHGGRKPALHRCRHELARGLEQGRALHLRNRDRLRLQAVIDQHQVRHLIRHFPEKRIACLQGSAFGGNGGTEGDLDIDLVIRAIDARAVVDEVGVEQNAIERRLDAATLGHAEVAAFANDARAH